MPSQGQIVKVVKATPHLWTTADGRRIAPVNLDQQHLSNIYWFFFLLYYVNHAWVLEQLKERYNGQLLPYRPKIHETWNAEIQELTDRGYLLWLPILFGDIYRRADIILNKRVIGEIVIPITATEYRTHTGVEFEDKAPEPVEVEKD